jgi:hypothetical protein
MTDKKEKLTRTERLKRILDTKFFSGDLWQSNDRGVRMMPNTHVNDADVELMYDILAEELDRVGEDTGTMMWRRMKERG